MGGGGDEDRRGDGEREEDDIGRGRGKWGVLSCLVLLHSGLLSMDETSHSTTLPPISMDSRSSSPLSSGGPRDRPTRRLPADERPLPALAKRYG